MYIYIYIYIYTHIHIRGQVPRAPERERLRGLRGQAGGAAPQRSPEVLSYYPCRHIVLVYALLQ